MKVLGKTSPLSLLSVGIAAGFVASAGGVHAGSIIIDDFAITQAMVNSTTPSSSTVNSATNYWSSRILSLGNLDNAVPAGSSIEVVNGQLVIINNSVSAVSAAVTWNLDLSKLSSILTNASVVELSIQEDDIAPAWVYVNGNLRGLGSNSTSNLVRIFSGVPANLGNQFNVQFYSASGTSSRWGALRLNFTCVAGATGLTSANTSADACPAGIVPLPGTGLLLGSGLIGIGLMGIGLMGSGPNGQQQRRREPTTNAK